MMGAQPKFWSIISEEILVKHYGFTRLSCFYTINSVFSILPFISYGFLIIAVIIDLQNLRRKNAFNICLTSYQMLTKRYLVATL